jgi:hypothetical protein
MFSMMTHRITELSIMTPSIATLSTMTFSIIIRKWDIQHNDFRIMYLNAYTECYSRYVVMVSVITGNVVILNVVAL